jgi:single-strand DNA-binding protein
MNTVLLIGNLTRDPELRYTTTQTAVCNFTLAIDRNQKEKGTDYPSIKVFGKVAENCEQFLKKGSKVGVQGRLQTGSFEKDGQKIFKTEVVADRVEFLDRKSAEPVPDASFFRDQVDF